MRGSGGKTKMLLIFITKRLREICRCNPCNMGWRYWRTNGNTLQHAILRRSFEAKYSHRDCNDFRALLLATVSSELKQCVTLLLTRAKKLKYKKTYFFTRKTMLNRNRTAMTIFDQNLYCQLIKQGDTKLLPTSGCASTRGFAHNCTKCSA